MIRRYLLVAALLTAAPVFAQSSTAARPADPVPADTAKAKEDGARADVDRHCLRETGTMIRSRRAKADGRCISYQAGRVYTNDDLRNTGQIDVVQALRTLDPAIR